ncbi:putative Heat shock factor binding 1 [Helianthus annuus]|uniref:Heat shock factor binding 1 n=1 Tax=Helianthus annuus TaxID=4232 RepID=A0A251VKL4_HELAN|nr:putative Heat shock factor binding 1 [Helianthus annuus]
MDKDGDGKQNTADMTQFVQTLLQQMQNRFQTMSDSIVSKNILFAYLFIKIL